MRAVVIAALFALLPAAALADTTATAKQFCAEKWQDDYRMQAYCVDRQHEAHGRFQAFYQKHDLQNATGSDPMYRIADRCHARWTEERRDGVYYTDLVMLDYCIEQQIEAYQRLHGD